MLEALCRDKSLLASVAVLPPGSNKVQQSPFTSTKQKMENVRKKAPVLGSAHLPPEQDLGCPDRISNGLEWKGP